MHILSEGALETIELHSVGVFDPKLVFEFKKLFENGTLTNIKTAHG